MKAGVNKERRRKAILTYSGTSEIEDIRKILKTIKKY